ncbi:MAG: triose-phosphate isomerase [Firmicutes bacterium HGW-Firmicutes-7]|nr:MAG: triose-phosphate isomerase [Firmicutes bacterium HGW-Firmicutes-7]
MRKKIVCFSWKMHINTRQEVDTLATGIRDLTKAMTELEIFLLPTFPLIPHLSQILEGSHIGWGAQNMAFADYGAYTGEVPPITLIDLGCKYVEIGHAERRMYFNESDQDVNKKVKLCLKFGMTPLACVGETESEKEEGNGYVKIRTQVLWALEGLSEEEIKKVILVYEPVWAIGKQEGASAEYVEEIHSFIRGVVAQEHGSEAAKAVRIIYGGSVKLESAQKLMKKENIDGLFAGRFALWPDKFAAIAATALRKE